MKIKMLVIISSLIWANISWAGSYGPKEKRVGAGVVLGDPSGLTIKGFISPRLSLGGIISWSFIDEAFLVVGDVDYEFLEIPIETDKISLPFYAGGGLKVGFDQGGMDKDRTIVGIRVPFGVAVQWTRHPLEVFFEVAPGIDLAPSTKGDLTGGIGARFYF